VVLVHGAMTTSTQSWSEQQSLAGRWTLVVPDRRGYEPNPPAARSDFEVDAADIALLLGDGAHLVGHSYGAICALLAAGLRPDVVRSLTLIEPPVHSLARGHPAVEEQIADHAVSVRTLRDPEAFLRAFLNRIGSPTENLPSPLPAALARRVRLLMNERPPWDADIPVDALRRAKFPTLVVSGGHNDTFEMLGDRLADALGGSRRAVLPGAGHLVQRLGEAFNQPLEAFLLDAEATWVSV
jgi:pimeloyl-ACP methyl ester carboxylesterase